MRLRDWLDPGNLDPDTLDELKNVLWNDDEILAQNLSVFPNPTDGLIQVRIGDISGDLRYEVYNLLGQRLQTKLVVQGQPIDLSDLPSSIYLLRITDESRNASITRKIILNK